MGVAWADASPAAARTFAEADEILGLKLSTICREGPAETINRTDIAQPALYVCATASYRALVEQSGEPPIVSAAGLSLGEYTALHLAGVFSFEAGLRLVAQRGRLMQDAAEASTGGMVALIGAEPDQALQVCRDAAEGDILVPANFNAPGQIVLSGHLAACERAVPVASGIGLRAAPLAVAGAFHSPLMQPAADGMVEALAGVEFERPRWPVWSNVTARPHDPDDSELLRQRLVEQVVQPVRWSESCQAIAADGTMRCLEMAPGSVLRGLMRRIDRNLKVISHDSPA
jgi:[acyl-carrier-protein] S-malonyltransferase